MKKMISLFLLTVAVYGANAQAVTSFNENFNTDCVSTGIGYTANRWQSWSNGETSGNWTCVPTLGRGGTPGVQCDGFFSGEYHYDTSYLFTPMLDLSGYSDSVYLWFDGKYESGAAKLTTRVVYQEVDSTTIGSIHTDSTVDISDRLTPAITSSDSLTWRTHQLNITQYGKDRDGNNIPFYVAFRYESGAASASRWTLDNIRTSPFRLAVPDIGAHNFPLAIAGYCTRESIPLSFDVPASGKYALAIYDIVGRQVYKEELAAQGGRTEHIISGLRLHAGMYVVKMGNENGSSIAKAMVE